jgi:hypothetical protein
VALDHLAANAGVRRVESAATMRLMRGLRVALLFTFCLAPPAARAQYFERTIVGAVGDGSSDDMAAFQTSLNAAAGGEIVAPPARYYIGENLTIPANTTLDCRAPFLTDGAHLSSLNTAPALVLDPAATIIARGPHAGIKNCLILASGITYPVSSEPGWIGIAVSDGGYSDLTLSHDTIVGFDTCAYVSGPRPWIDNLYADCTGVSRAALELDVGNTDSGYVINVKFQDIGSQRGCSVIIRPGTGLRVAGKPEGTAGVWLDNIVSQNFHGYDFDFENGVIFGNLWGDDVGHACNSYGAAIGMKIAGGAVVYGGTINVNQARIGIIDHGMLLADFVNSGFAGSDCLRLSGTFHVREYFGSACLGKAIVIESPDASFDAQDVTLVGDDNGELPYITSAAGPVAMGAAPFGQVYFRSLTTDQVGANLFDANFSLANGGDDMISAMGLGATCSATGIGAGGTCAVPSIAGDAFGILIVPGPEAAASGAVALTFPVSAKSFLICEANFNDNGSWSPSASLRTGTRRTPPAQLSIAWNNGAPLLAGAQYIIYGHCDYR